LSVLFQSKPETGHVVIQIFNFGFGNAVEGIFGGSEVFKVAFGGFVGGGIEDFYSDVKTVFFCFGHGPIKSRFLAGDDLIRATFGSFSGKKALVLGFGRKRGAIEFFKVNYWWFGRSLETKGFYLVSNFAEAAKMEVPLEAAVLFAKFLGKFIGGTASVVNGGIKVADNRVQLNGA